jgi:hypothetical protein
MRERRIDLILRVISPIAHTQIYVNLCNTALNLKHHEYYDELNVSDDQTRDISTEAQTSDSNINTSNLKNYLCASY